MAKFKKIMIDSLLFGTGGILGILVGEGINSFEEKYNVRKVGRFQKVYIPEDIDVNRLTISDSNNELNNHSEQQGGAESKFYTLFLGTIGFLDDSVRNFIIPLLSNTIDQIVSFLQNPKIDPKKVLMFFLVNTVLIIFGLLFNKIKRQIKTKNI